MPGGPVAHAERRPSGPRAGYWVAILGLACLVGALWLLPHGAPPPAHSSAEPEPPPKHWVDPAQIRIGRTPSWADPRWLERIQARVAAEPPFTLGPESVPLERLRTDLASFSFVERVGVLQATAERGLVIELTLRKPVACIPVAGEFALVDASGVVLEGRWPLPPRLGRAYLPVLGPLDDPLFARARAGDWLAEPEHADALDVALSLAEEVPEDERAALGRIVIDARTARRASLAEPGVRLELEGGRLALFGRAPGADEPGELASDHKWRGLVRAFDWYASDPAANDWRLVDLRWDRPDLALAAAPELAQVEPVQAPRGRVRRGESARDAGPRVR